MAMDTQERPDVTERYEVACNTSTLKVEERTAGPGDILIAAGWSPTRIGMALLRLASEWDGAAKPKRMKKPQIEALAAWLKEQDETARVNRDRENGALARLEALRDHALEAGKQPGFDLLVAIMEQRKLYEAGSLPKPPIPKLGDPMARAITESALWYRRELMLLANSLKSRVAVQDQLTQWAILKGIDPLVVGPALHHWLSDVCPVCDGHGLRKVPDAPALSARRCHHCHGTGKVPSPEGSSRVLVYIDRCLDQARQSLKHRLRPGR